MARNFGIPPKNVSSPVGATRAQVVALRRKLIDEVIERRAAQIEYIANAGLTYKMLFGLFAAEAVAVVVALFVAAGLLG